MLADMGTHGKTGTADIAEWSLQPSKRGGGSGGAGGCPEIMNREASSVCRMAGPGENSVATGMRALSSAVLTGVKVPGASGPQGPARRHCAVVASGRQQQWAPHIVHPPDNQN